jgi:putative addiction module CopG family antidote
MAAIEKRTFSLPAEHAAFIDAQVASGAFASGSEVVRAGLRALQERDAAVEPPRVPDKATAEIGDPFRGRLVRKSPPPLTPPRRGSEAAPRARGEGDRAASPRSGVGGRQSL